MKKVVLSSLGKFQIVESEKPIIYSDNDVLVKVSSVGVCGSDIHYFRTGRIGDQIIDYPFTPGHECTGTVEEIGSEVHDLVPGDRVAIEPAISCGHCDQCQLRRYHTCRNLQFLGNPVEREGCMQEYIVLPKDCCFKLPDYISLKDGVIIEPLSIALHAADFMEASDSITILGCGPIGISTLFALRIRATTPKIYMTDKVDDRLSFAKRKGADWTANPLAVDIVDEITKIVPQGVDTVFECCGQQDAVNQAIELLKPGGQLIMLGIPEEETLAIDFHNLRRKEITLNNVRRQNEKFLEAIKFMRPENLNLSGFVSHSFAPEKTQSAFEIVESYTDGVMKAIIQFDDMS